MKLVISDNGTIDLGIGSNGALLVEETLNTAVIISLLTDRRANIDDRLPDDTRPTGPLPPDRRGWCGDALADIDGDRVGSRLWLLSREKQTEETRQRAITYCKEALKWLIDDGHITAMDVDAAWLSRGFLVTYVTLTLPDGTKFKSVVTTGGPFAV